MLEIIKYLVKLENVTLDDVIAIANTKSSKRGAFNEKIFLEKVLKNDQILLRHFINYYSHFYGSNKKT